MAVVVLLAGVAAWRVGGSDRSTRPSPGSAARAHPLIALVATDGSLATIDLAGRRTTLAAEAGVVSGFPAWSPDGTQVAAVQVGPADSAISVYAVPRDGPAPSPSAPVVIYRSAAVPPFYLYWTPDGRHVSFLATEADGISLRIAPSDGSAPLDGSGPGAIIRQGSPLYFDWIAADRLILHVGSGADAFLGEVGRDGSALGPGLADAGDFRPAVVGADGRFIAFVRGRTPTAALVVTARDGSAEHTLPVFGPAAAVFDPAGQTVATIASDSPSAADLAFPLGPLRLVDPASGVVRTLLDGSVIGFFWSPDGRTIAALRLQRGSGSTTADGRIVSVAAIAATTPEPTASPTPPPGTELHLLFLDVATGAVRSDRVVRLTSHFINQFLPYFDQYALSHRVWAPDGSSILLPLVDSSGRDQLVIVPPDGSAGPPPIDGESGFWSP